MSKKKTFDLSELPPGLADEMKSFVKELMGAQNEDEELKPLVTISEKDLIRYIKLKSQRNMLMSLLKAMDGIDDEVQNKITEWWENIEDKYSIKPDLNLNLNTETRVISERIKKDRPDLEIVKKDNPIN